LFSFLLNFSTTSVIFWELNFVKSLNWPQNLSNGMIQ